MKKLLIALAIILCGINSEAQITLDHTYYNTNNVRIIMFTNAGYKMAAYPNSNTEIKLYDFNYTLWKTLPIPSYTGYTSTNNSILWVSDRLFNNTDDVEFAIHYNGVGANPDKLEIIGENGVVLFSTMMTSGYFIFQDGQSHYKLQVRHNDTIDMYALPGELPCNPCSNLSIAMNKEAPQMPFVSEPTPNPGNEQVSVHFVLPTGDKKGEITISNTTGQVVRTYEVLYGTNELKIDTRDLPAGNYYYRLVTDSGVSGGMKMTIVR